jgi:hypothetical protein
MRTLALAVVLAAASCGGNPDPDPEPTPPPWECPLPMPGCHEVGQHCSSEASPCWHNPTTDPEHCEEAPACPPDPDPDPDPPGPCIVEADLVPATCGAAEYRREVKAATDALGDLTGKPPQENLEALAAKLAEEGLCVIAGHEAVFILRSDGLAEENHAVFFGDGGWTGSGFGKFIGCHSGVPEVVCGEPDPLGLPGQFNLKRHHRWWDSTYLVHREYEYCVAAGFVQRASCPVRKEGNYQRRACERRVIGDQQWWCDGEPIEPRPENPAQAECVGQVKTCTEDGQTCAHAVW